MFAVGGSTCPVAAGLLEYVNDSPAAVSWARQDNTSCHSALCSAHFYRTHTHTHAATLNFCLVERGDNKQRGRYLLVAES